ncbi:CopG family transcriptional regulator [Acidianus sulfidivorans JP7]|uniref:CopG family transcriptional regulator n=1 Tax=Acidianus sulfidivorans JP7 TaxID=619593 RepID=A0A2U9IN18_9CREN|nr:CopG family transcriptional regulator [Acidianus sulfidivorans]AWR97334.1 CopG family transcriptional regulator [Acidianus sulfidivorans JP7]
MKTIIIKLTDDEYRQLEEEARKEGYTLINSYIRSKLLSSGISSDMSSQGGINTDELVKKIERKVQDMVNPFTAEVDNLKRKIAELSEKIDNLEELQKVAEKNKSIKSIKSSKYENTQQKPHKTIMELLKEQGAIYESEISTRIKNPDSFFEKIEKSGGKILYTEKERIAVDQDFYNNFLKKLSEIHTSDDIEAQKFLTRQEYKLFQKLRALAIIYFDGNTKSWKITAT